MRVVSLVPSVTETLLAWDVTPIAVTRFCEQPDLPAVGGTKDPDVAAIVGLRPDLVVLNDEENRREDADALETAGVPVHVVSVRSVADVAPACGALALRLGLDPPPPAVEVDPGHRSDVRARRVFVPVWRRPWMTMNGDTYGSSLLAACGVENVFSAAPDRYPQLGGLAAAVDAGADLVLAPSEPFPFGPRHRTELEAVAPVVFVDGRDLFWWGVRTPVALERLRESLSR